MVGVLPLGTLRKYNVGGVVYTVVLTFGTVLRRVPRPSNNLDAHTLSDGAGQGDMESSARAAYQQYGAGDYTRVDHPRVEATANHQVGRASFCCFFLHALAFSIASN